MSLSPDFEHRNCRRLPVVLVLALVLAGCATGPAPDTAGVRAPAVHGSVERGRILSVARNAIGAPYRYGGDTPGGFDCSGLVHFAHRTAGIDVPRTADMQWRHARRTTSAQVRPGDLLFFSLGGDKARHVGIYEGDGLFIHAPSSGKRVGRASLDNPYWRTRLIGTGTFL